MKTRIHLPPGKPPFINNRAHAQPPQLSTIRSHDDILHSHLLSLAVRNFHSQRQNPLKRANHNHSTINNTTHWQRAPTAYTTGACLILILLHTSAYFKPKIRFANSLRKFHAFKSSFTSSSKKRVPFSQSQES